MHRCALSGMEISHWGFFQLYVVLSANGVTNMRIGESRIQRFKMEIRAFAVKIRGRFAGIISLPNPRNDI